MNARLRSPFLGYFVLAQIYLNYSAFALLLWGEGTVDERLDAFSSVTSVQSFVVYPIIAALVGGIVGPWITYGGAWIAKWPTEKLKKLQDDEARKIRIHNFEQAIEELQAEEEYNLRKVAVAESLDKAQEVGGDELVEEIKAGPSQPREAQNVSEDEHKRLVTGPISELEMGPTKSSERLLNENGLTDSSEGLDNADKRIILAFADVFSPAFRKTFGTGEFPLEFYKSYLDAIRTFLDMSEEPWFELSNETLNAHLGSFTTSLEALMDLGQYAFDIPSPGNMVEVRPDIYEQEFSEEYDGLYEGMDGRKKRLLLLDDQGQECVKRGDAFVRSVRHFAPQFYSDFVLQRAS